LTTHIFFVIIREMERFERFIRETEPYFREYLEILRKKGKPLLPSEGYACFDEEACQTYKEHADFILKRILEEEEKE